MTARRTIITAMLAGVALVVAPAWSGHQPRYIWNASASVPVGLYRIAPADRIEVTDLVVVLPPEPLATFLDERGYLPRGVPLLKRVLALGGTKVCREGAEIVAYDTVYGTARERDSRGRKLPEWHGCGIVAADEAFLMNWNAADSLDGRYFGPLPLSSIFGRAVPAWTFEAPAEPSGARSPRVRMMLVRPKHTLLPATNRSSTMPRIGTFTRNEDGSFGDIRTLMLRAKISILPADNPGTENAPDHRAFCDGTEIGAAWERTGEKAGSYLSVVIDDPSFPRPIHARLFQSDAENGAWTLHWSRPSRREQRD